MVIGYWFGVVGLLVLRFMYVVCDVWWYMGLWVVGIWFMGWFIVMWGMVLLGGGVMGMVVVINMGDFGVYLRYIGRFWYGVVVGIILGV